MNKSRKVTLLVLSLVALVCVLGAIVVFFVMFKDDLGLTFQAFGNLYTYLFNNGGASDSLTLTISILLLVFTVLIIAALILGIVFVCVKKLPKAMLSSFLLLLAGFPAALVIAFAHGLLEYYKMSEEFIVLVFLILAILGFFLSLIVYVLTLILWQ